MVASQHNYDVDQKSPSRVAWGRRRQREYLNRINRIGIPLDYHGSGARSRKASEVQVGKDQEKAQSEKDSHSKNRGGKKLN